MVREWGSSATWQAHKPPGPMTGSAQLLIPVIHSNWGELAGRQKGCNWGKGGSSEAKVNYFKYCDEKYEIIGSYFWHMASQNLSNTGSMSPESLLIYHKCILSTTSQYASSRYNLDIGKLLWMSVFFMVIFFNLGAVSIRKTVLPGMAIPMLKIRRPNGRLIFNMEIAIRR